MNTNWKKVKFGELAQINMGQSPPGESCNREGFGMPLLNGPTEFGTKYPSPIQWTNNPKKIANAGDILFCVRGSTTGRMNIANREYAIGRGLAAIRSNYDSKLQALLKAIIELNLQSLLSQATGSTFPNLSKEQLNNFRIEIPEFKEQLVLSSIISTYDDLIDINQKRIKILEEMAQRLYTDWFVKFKFPGHEKIKMVDSGTEYGTIPERWKVQKLSSFADLIMGQSPTSDNYNTNMMGVPFHQGVADYGEHFPDDRVFSTAGTKFAFQSDLLFSVRAPVGRINIALHKIILGRGLCAIRHKNGYQSTLFLMFSNKFTQKDMIGNGAIYKSVNKTELENLAFIHSPDQVGQIFDKYFTNYIDEIRVLTLKNRKLILLRDLLIPNLISGRKKLDRVSK